MYNTNSETIMKLKLYSSNNKYAFCIDGFSSRHHSSLSSGCQETYQYAWEAYRFAKTLGAKHKYHIEAMKNKRYAIEDLTKPVTIDIDAEEMLGEHYQTIFNIIEQKSEGLEKDEDQREIVYGEIKSVVDEVLKIQEELENKKVETQISSIMSKFRHLVHAKFHDLLQKDIKEQKDNPPQEAPVPASPPPADPSQAEPPPDNTSLQEASDNAIGANSFIKVIKTSANKNTTVETKEDLFDEYGTRVCKAIEKKHPDAICKIDLDSNHLNIIEAKTGDLILRVGLNNDLNVEEIIPFGSVSSIFPANSFEFYQRYWKPIVESVGHFFVKEASTILQANNISFPDIPNKRSASYTLRGLKSDGSVDLWFKYQGESLWGFSKSAQKVTQQPQDSKDAKKTYTEDDFIVGSPKEVMCIDQALKSIYGKTGQVVRVIPLQTHIEVDVDFGRAIMRLTGDQIKIINIDDLQTGI